MIRKKGFTLVELNLAVFFVALLLLGVAMTTIHISKIYQRGSTVKMINQLGREINGQLRRDIATAKKIELKTAANTGRICLGDISYIYNEAGASSGLITRPGGTEQVYLVRVNDPGASWCDDSSGTLRTTLEPSDTYTELLTNDVIPLAIHNLAISEHSPVGTIEAVKQKLFLLTMELGTNEAGTTGGGKCLPPSDNEANFDNCFIAEFETVIRAGEVRE